MFLFIITGTNQQNKLTVTAGGVTTPGIFKTLYFTTMPQPKRKDKDNATAPSAEKGTKPGDARKTYIVSIALADKLEGIAWQDRTSIKNVVNDALAAHVAKWEKKNGPAPSPPKK